jgi:excinuclease UvrABC nuclease subunit
MNWRSIGDGKEARYPEWLRALDGKHGAYAIREQGWFFSRVLYVGESHTKNLYKTITRHFQSWRRGKKFWSGQYAPAQTDPGHTYERRPNIEVAVVVTRTGAAALTQQAKWIRTLKPRDNVALVDEREEAPF